MPSLRDSVHLRAFPGAAVSGFHIPRCAILKWSRVTGLLSTPDAVFIEITAVAETVEACAYVYVIGERDRDFSTDAQQPQLNASCDARSARYFVLCRTVAGKNVTLRTTNENRIRRVGLSMI